MKAKLTQRPAAPIRVQRQRAPAMQVRAQSQAPLLHVIDGGLDSRNLMRLQSAAGNQAVGELLARPRLSVQAQAVACPPPPAAAAPVAPQQDPKFVAVKERIAGESVKQKAHPPAKAKVAEAQGAAQGPANEVPSKAAAAQVDEMSEQKPKGFDKAAFTSAVHVAIEKSTPKNMEEVDEFKSSGKAGQIKDQVVGQVTQNKDIAAKDIKAASAAAPDPSKAEAKQVTPMAGETPGAPPRDVKAGEAMPAPKPADQVSLDNTKCETDSQLSQAHVTDEQVANSNEPQFQDAMAAKKGADDHAATAPQQFREGEKEQLGAAQSGAAAATTAGLGQMHQSRASAAGHVGSQKDEAKAKHEAALAKVSTEIEGIYNGTKKDVEDILNGLDKSVADAFDSGEKAAREAFENDYTAKKEAYFAKRYAGYEGAALWVADKLTSPPPEVNGFIDKAKQVYVSKMEVVINQVANLVETELNRATMRIQLGRTQIKDYVAQQPKELQQVASQAATQISSKFDGLDQAVTEKSNAVVDDLAQKYAAASKGVDDRCNAMREENKGLLDKAKDQINAMVDTIKKMKDMLASMAARAGNAVEKIIDKPIEFLGNLIGAVKAGFGQFVDNIWTHLKKGLLTWLFGEVAKAGITLPEKFDLKGILMFLAQVLGLSWANLRSRAVKILGAKVVGMIEKGVAVVQKAIEIYNVIKTEGIAGVWHLIQDKITEIKAQVMEAVGGMVVVEVIKAGVKWIIGLLNPASAFVKACIAIYDIIMFFVNHGSEIVELVNAIVDNLEAIVAGGISSAANLVEKVLGRAIPIAIGFLASLLGLGDLGSKIKAILDKIREPVNMAIDWVLSNVIKPIISAVGSGIEWAKEKLFGKKDADQEAEPVKGAISVPFGMQGESHTLSVMPGAGASLSMASVSEKQMAVKVQQALQSVEKQRQSIDAAKSELATLRSSKKKPGRQAILKCYIECAEAKTGPSQTSQIEQLDAISALSNKAQETARTEQPQEGKYSQTQVVLEQLRDMMESYATRYDLNDLGPMAVKRPKELGEAMPYGATQPGRDVTFGPLEAEHIMPGKVLKLLISDWSRTIYTDATYSNDFTLLIPRAVADTKTDVGGPGLLSDQAEIRRIKDIVEDLKASLAGEPLDPDKIVQLNQFFDQRRGLTIVAKNQLVASVRAGKVVPPKGKTSDEFADEVADRCSDEKINEAVMTQLADIWQLAKDAQAAATAGAGASADGKCSCDGAGNTPNKEQ